MKNIISFALFALIDHMYKIFLIFSFLISLAAQAMPNPGVVSCGDFLDESKRQFMFELDVKNPGESQSFYFNAGWPHNFEHVEIRVVQSKVSTGILSHNVIFDSGDGRFRIERAAGLVGGSDNWILNINIPELNVNLQDYELFCIGM